jgi:hypothetical protein
MGELINLICLPALNEASRKVESAQCRCGKAAAALMKCRSELDRVVERAYEAQSFGPINGLFNVEEAALAAFEQARTELAQAEERWWALKVALAYEKRLMAAGSMSRNRLN